MSSAAISKVMSEISRKRWAKATAEDRAEVGRKLAASRSYSPEQRAEIGRRLAAGRAAKRAAAKNS